MAVNVSAWGWNDNNWDGNNDNQSSSGSVDHIDINVTAVVDVKGTPRTIDLQLTKADAKNVTVTATQGGEAFNGFS